MQILKTIVKKTGSSSGKPHSKGGNHPLTRSMASVGRVRSYCAELGGNAPVLVFADTRNVEEAGGESGWVGLVGLEEGVAFHVCYI